jgi:hypothetical protein
LDGGDDYFRGGGSLGPVSDKEFCLAVDRDEALQKLIEEVVEDDMFNDDSFLDDDFDDYNLGYQAGALDERERILHGIQKLEDQSHATKTPLYQDTMFAKVRKIING